MTDIIKNLDEITKIFNSKKRMAILIFLFDAPLGYTSLLGEFTRRKIKIGSSEIYKHIHFLKAHGYIDKKAKQYLITSKGIKSINIMVELVNTLPEVPKIVYDFGDKK